MKLAAVFVWERAIPYLGLVLIMAWLFVNLKPVAFSLIPKL